jgi:hypothetical protein
MFCEWQKKSSFLRHAVFKKVEQRKHLTTLSNGSAEANFYVTIKWTSSWFNYDDKITFKTISIYRWKLPSLNKDWKFHYYNFNLGSFRVKRVFLDCIEILKKIQTHRLHLWTIPFTPALIFIISLQCQLCLLRFIHFRRVSKILLWFKPNFPNQHMRGTKRVFGRFGVWKLSKIILSC